MKRIYLDYASLTPIDKRVSAEIKKYSGAEFANASSLYKEGVASKKAMDASRHSVAEFLNAHSDEIIFTSGGTESNALVLEGAGRAARRSGTEKPHLVISSIEHSSIMETAGMLEKHGAEVTRLAVDRHGHVNPEDIRKAIKPSTYLVSVMAVNNEIGAIEPIREIAKAVRWARKNITKSHYPLFHTDASQAPLFEDLNVEQLGIDLLTLDGSKVYGPRGIGALFIRRGAPVEQIIYGGGQERGLRSGTENIPAICGLAKALIIAENERQSETKRVRELKELFFAGLKKVRPEIKLNGSLEESSPSILNIEIPGIDSEFFVLQMDARGIAASTKSSCLRDAEESYVLRAIGAESRNSVRFSFGRFTKGQDIKKSLKIIASILAKKA